MTTNMKQIGYIGMALTIAALVACNNEDELLPADAWQNDPAAVRVSAAVGGSFTRSNPLGSEAEQTQFNPGDRMAIAAGTQASVTYKLQTDGTWTPDPTGSYLKWEADEMTFTAYYPATPGTSATTFALTTEQSSADAFADIDYMTFSGLLAKPAGSSAVSLQMKRQTARVVVKISKFNDEFAGGTPTVTGLKIRSGADGYTDGQPTPDSPTDITPYAQPAGTAQVGTTYTALVIPTEEQPDEPFVTLTVNGKALTVRGIPEMTAGTSYTYNLTVGKESVNVGEVTVAPWTGGTIAGGEAEEEHGPDATTHTIWTIKEGEIADAANAGWIADAIGTGTSLTVTGPMNEDDLKAIATYLKSLSGTPIDLDLSDAELTSVPDLTFGSYFDDEAAQSLGQVNLPTTITEIGENAFRYCNSFTIANWDELTSLTTIGNAAFMGSGLSGNITLPESITTIEGMAFYQTNITSIVFPSSITTIGIQMLYRCYRLKKVVFKGDVKSLDEIVFGACSALEEIDFSACTNMPTYKSNPFADIITTNINKITLKVKSDLVESFKGDENWKKCNVIAAE